MGRATQGIAKAAFQGPVAAGEDYRAPYPIGLSK